MNRYYPHTIIAQEGWTFIIGGVVVSVIIMLLCGWWSLPFWLATLFMLNFFRDPARNIPEAPDAILSPADGRVVVVEKAVDPYRNVETLKISIFMNVFDVHSQRAPARGKITEVRYTAGKKLNASLDKASSENERNAVLMTTASGREITFVQIAGLVARRILCYVNKGDSLVRGERYGFIRFGSRVDVYLPLDANPNVAIGDKVRATETILAFLPLEQDPNFDPNQVQIQSHVSPAARLKADKIERSHHENHAQDDLDAQIRERVAAQFQQENPSHAAPSQNQIAKEELEVAARLAKIQAERQAEAAERERILAAEAAEAEEVRQRIAKEEAEQAAKAEAERIAAEQAKLKAEQEAKAEAERIAAEQVRLQAEQAAKAEAERIAAEQARLQAEQAAKAEAEHIAAEQARLQAEQAAKAEAAERIAAEQARLQAEQAAKAEAERIAAEQARLQAEQAAKAEAERIAAEQARLQAEQAAKAEAERIAAEQARLQAEQAAKAEAERIAAEQARLQAEQAAKAEAERAAEQARLQAEQAAKAEAERAAEQARIQAAEQAKAHAERLAEQARLQAEQQKAEAERIAHEQKLQAAKNQQAQSSAHDSFHQAEAKALAEIAAREPIVRRESFASVPEPWQTIEPSEVVIKVENK